MSFVTEKIAWSGRITSVQPRIRLSRSFDEWYHNYLGYVLQLDGTLDEMAERFLVAVGKGAHTKYQFVIGMELSGFSALVNDQRLEIAGFYKTSRIKTLSVPENPSSSAPPFGGVPPELETYRSRGHRRLSSRTYDTKCLACIWGCRMPVEIILDKWNQSKKKYRFETFCYGPKSCKFYSSGPTRKVPGHGGLTYEIEDWIEDEMTSHRREDD